MKKRIFFGIVLTAIVAMFVGQGNVRRAAAVFTEWIVYDADVNPETRGGMDKQEYLRRRAEAIALKRGISKDKPFDPLHRMEAIRKMERQEAEGRSDSPDGLALDRPWLEIGPAPIPNGAVATGPSAPVSGRVISIAVHPSDPEIVFAGTSSGGLYRSLNGGANWTRLTEQAMSLSIGALAIAPSQPETLYVGTGDPNLFADCFTGVGVYRIDNATTTATLSGPFGISEFNHAGISAIAVHPTDPGTIFVSTTDGFGGIIPSFPNVPPLGVFRSTNAHTSNPTFSKLDLFPGNHPLLVITDLVMDPADANRIIVATGDINGVAAPSQRGIYLSTNALAPVPTFNLTRNLDTIERTELAINRSGSIVTVYAATGFGSGQVWRSVDGGESFTLRVDNNFCQPQCIFDVAIEVNPANASNVFLGGSPALVFGRSSNAGVTFTGNGANFTAGLHVDTHVIRAAPSNPAIVYLGTDGGIYRTTNVNATPIVWENLNNQDFSATQFMSIAAHGTDPNFTIGGTQDNGTNFFTPERSWRRVDGGDGGETVVDQTDTSTTAVDLYHIYFNAAFRAGYAHAEQPDGPWTFRGCTSPGATTNGITCNDTAHFYAPLEAGPPVSGSLGNTLYFGADRLYRSTDRGLNHAVVSQVPIVAGLPISAVGISPTDDNVRVVGLFQGGLYGTTTGASVLADLDPTNQVPEANIGKVVIDPQHPATAYVTLSAFTPGVAVWKTTNLNANPPTWTLASSGLPDVPVSAFAVDPDDSNRLFAGTDIGVYTSADGGSNWIPLGTGLPRVPVFDMVITPAQRKLRIATHGRGLWEYPIETRRTPFDYDGDGKTDYSVFRPSTGAWYLQRSTVGFLGLQFGAASDKLTPADYDGDGKTDIAVYRPGDGRWYILHSATGTVSYPVFGVAEDVPAPGDYDGDGKADLTVFRPSQGTWYRQNSSNGSFFGMQFGANGDVPTVGDFDGDGKNDLGIFRPSVGDWYNIRSSNGSVFGERFGQTGDKIAPADYDGDGKTDIAIYRPSTGLWVVRNSATATYSYSVFGAVNDVPVAGDYDGDGKADIGVWRPSDGTWYVQRSSNGSFIVFPWGQNGDRPTPSAFGN